MNKQINVWSVIWPYILLLPGWRIWLRRHHTSRKAACSISDGVTGSFHWLNPSGGTRTLGPTQPLKEMSTTGLPWDKDGLCIRLTTLTFSCADCLKIPWASTFRTFTSTCNPYASLLPLHITDWTSSKFQTYWRNDEVSQCMRNNTSVWMLNMR
jgi:hypothetical protein